MSTDAARAILSSHNGPLMVSALSAAVPLWAQGYTHDPIELILDGARMGFISQEIAEKGDVLQFGGKSGEPARLFNLLAEGIARASYCPGGIKTFGMHFEYEPGKWAQGKHGVPVGQSISDTPSLARTIMAAPRTRPPTQPGT